jgi:hypothetical protein
MTATESSPLHHIAARYGAHATVVFGYRDKPTDRAQLSMPLAVFHHSPAWITSLAHAEAPIHPTKAALSQGLLPIQCIQHPYPYS